MNVVTQCADEETVFCGMFKAFMEKNLPRDK